MKVKLLTTEQAKSLHKRFDKWFEILPIPVKNGKWIVSIDTLLALKEMVIDKIQDRPNLKDKAIALRDAVIDLPTYETDDYPGQIYDHSNEQELTEYTARFADLDPREDIE